ncbi:lipid-A-disaccharide synthase [Candidatus Pelagibacter sp.]|nr:lipid-A-disaccharide synthase [Candidatus Pelagibacter sp.]
MKKIFVLTGEPSGDKLASTAISKLQKDYTDIEYLSVGGSNLRKIGIESIFDLKEITYLGFTSVLLNIFKINKRINQTVKEILKFNPDILFSVDSPDFTLRVAEKVKKINPQIKTIHYVAPQVWIWRRGRVKKMKKFIDHVLLLFNFEKKYFDEESIKNTFVGHPLIEKTDSITILGNLMTKYKNVISIFPGSRKSEIDVLLPIIFNFIKKMNINNHKYDYFIHTNEDNISYINNKVEEIKIKNIEVIFDEDIKEQVLLNSVFAVCKSGTVSLQVSNSRVPSIIIYKLSFMNFLIFKMLVNVKFANIINIINNQEVIPELLQDKCNDDEIYKSVLYMLKNPEIAQKQIEQCNETLKGIRSKSSSSNEVAKILRNSLIG